MQCFHTDTQLFPCILGAAKHTTDIVQQVKFQFPTGARKQCAWEAITIMNLPRSPFHDSMIPFAQPLTRYGIVELILAEGDPPWRSPDNRLLKFVVLRGQSLQRRGEDLILLHLVLQFQTVHLSSTDKHASTHTHTPTHHRSMWKVKKCYKLAMFILIHSIEN